MSRSITPDQENAVRVAYARTGSVRASARDAGVSFWTADRVVKEDCALPRGKAQPESEPGEINTTEAIGYLRRSPHSIDELARKLKTTPEAVKVWIDTQWASGLNLHQANGQYSIERTPAPVDFGRIVYEVESDEDNTFTLGALGDSHLCSKCQRLDVLNDLYDAYEREGITRVFHTGNWIDGEARFNRFDILVHGADAQLRYLAEHYPQRAGIHTYAIAGDDHEGWYCQREGIDIGRIAEMRMRDAGRTDWHNLGYMEAYVRLVNRDTRQSSMLHVVHPGGGSAYALSYTVQKFVESYAGGEKPAVLLMGHYHKMEKVLVRGVFCVQTGCQQDQTPFMRKKKLEAHVGGHVIRLKQDPRTGAILEMDGIKRYFNIGYYNDRWSHSGPVKLPRRELGGVA